jgi:Leucine-rich repeat (LRR) protein
MALAVLPKFERVDEGVFPAKERSAFEEARRRQLTESPEVVAANRAWWEATVRASPKMLGLVHREISKAAKALGEDPKLAKKAPSDAVLAKALRLTSLHFGEMGLETLELVQPFRQADWLNLSHNAVADLTPLAELRGLRLLLLRHMGLTSLKPLAPLGAVRELQCNDNQLTSLEGLGGWRTLRELAAQNNPLRDLSALAELDLSILHLERTEVDSLEVLKTHRSLERLWIFGTKVTDLSPLASCPSLKELVCFSLPGLGGAMALTGLPRLRSIVSHQSLSADEVAAFRAARPDVRID